MSTSIDRSIEIDRIEDQNRCGTAKGKSTARKKHLIRSRKIAMRRFPYANIKQTQRNLVSEHLDRSRQLLATVGLAGGLAGMAGMAEMAEMAGLVQLNVISLLFEEKERE